MASQPSTPDDCGRAECIGGEDFPTGDNPVLIQPLVGNAQQSVAVCESQGVDLNVGALPPGFSISGLNIILSANIFQQRAVRNTADAIAAAQITVNAQALAFLTTWVNAALADGTISCGLWSPDDLISGARNWLFADDPAFSALADGAVMPTQWPDHGTYGWGMFMTGTDTTYRTNVLNGLPVVRKGTVGDAPYSTVSAATSSRELAAFGPLQGDGSYGGLSGLSMIAVARTSSTTGTVHLWTIRSDCGSTDAHVRIVNTGPRVYSYGGKRLQTDAVDDTNGTTAISNARYDIICAVFDYSLAIKYLWINGTNESTDNPFQTVGTSRDVCGTGGYHELLANNVNNEWNGDLAEIAVVEYAFPDSERQKFEGYLAWKYGLTANLPIGHPYKNTPPLP